MVGEKVGTRLEVIFNRLEIDAKQIRFAAATLQLYGMNSYFDLSVAWSQ